MIWDSLLRFLVDLGWFVGVWVALALAIRVVRRVARWLPTSRLAWWIRRRRARRRGAATPQGPPPPDPAPPAWSPEWSAALLVRPFGEGWLSPSIQLSGSPFPGPARIRLELIDEEGAWHRVSERDVSDSDRGMEIWLPQFRPPKGNDVDDALAWIWRVVLELGHEEHVLCLERLRPVTGLTREAELGVSGGAAV